MPDSTPEIRPTDPHGTVLYIEDDLTNVALVQGLLADFPGVEVIVATTGEQGVHMARTSRPDLVLLDMHLPDFGGLEVIRALSLEISMGLKVALLTGDSFSMDIVKAMSLGAFDYWVKPIDPKRLLDGVRRGLRPGPGAAEGAWRR